MRDPSGAALSGGSVVLIPSGELAALAMQPIDLSLAPDAARELAVDEPIEDLLAARGDDFPRADVRSEGDYRFVEVLAGQYFVVYRPAPADTSHLPGGSACRMAVDARSLAGTRLDIRVSSAPSERATYAGSSSCFNCHGRHRTMRTAHRLSLQVPGVRGAYQDSRLWGDVFDPTIRSFAAGKTLYFYACDTARAGDAKCRVSETDPSVTDAAAVPAFEVRVSRDPSLADSAPGAYTAEFRNRAGTGTATYPLVLSYGGALGRQQFVVRRTHTDESYRYYVLPILHQSHGSNEAASPDDWPYRDYRAEDWYDLTTQTLREPPPERSFDADCAGCHLTGFQLTGAAESGFRARAVSDAQGDFDYDGDGRADEINIGCESCHGPGSEHIESRVRGSNIVSPSLLTPERELMLCGRCHSRPQGVGGGGTQAPLSASGNMPPPGIRRAVFTGFTQRVDAAATDLYASGDSRAFHQQYTDFLRSDMARNASVLMTCSNCHDPHGSDDHPHELRSAPDDNAACTSCHSEARYIGVRMHLQQVTGSMHEGVDDTLLRCISCHMVKTVVAGARRSELLDNLPRGTPEVQYLHGDIASHRFTVTRRAAASSQPVAATLGCAFCHSTLLDVP